MTQFHESGHGLCAFDDGFVNVTSKPTWYAYFPGNGAELKHFRCIRSKELGVVTRSSKWNENGVWTHLSKAQMIQLLLPKHRRVEAQGSRCFLWGGSSCLGGQQNMEEQQCMFKTSAWFSSTSNRGSVLTIGLTSTQRTASVIQRPHKVRTDYLVIEMGISIHYLVIKFEFLQNTQRVNWREMGAHHMLIQFWLICCGNTTSAKGSWATVHP